MSVIRRIQTIFLISALFTFSCSTSKKFESSIASENCDEALYEAPHNKADFRFASDAQENVGKLISYTATGAGFTADFAFLITSHVLVAITVCSPFLAIDGALHTNGKIAEACFKGVDIKSSELGPNIYKKTQQLRCPPVDTISVAIRKVAQCYVKKGDSENYQKALKNLSSVTNSKEFYKCLSPDEKNNLDVDVKNINKLMTEPKSAAW